MKLGLKENMTKNDKLCLKNKKIFMQIPHEYLKKFN